MRTRSTQGLIDMSGIDANRLMWQIIETVSKYLHENICDNAEDLEKQFTKTYKSSLDQIETEDSSKLHLLIKEFKPTLSSILQPGMHFDRITELVSPILNDAFAKAEKVNIESSVESQHTLRRLSEPKTHVIQLYDKAESMKILSVGIDIGSSTTHLVFSRLKLNRERSFTNPSNRFMVEDREVLYESNIIFTPLLDRVTIDVGAIVEFCEEEYRNAGFTPEMVDTGAVIVTGETAKKSNAEEIVQHLSSTSGKFVSAVAGPNYESILGIMGSGILELSSTKNQTIMNVDIGGGTSNMAISSKGHIHSTSCINVGGRLLGIDKDLKIWRIDEPTKFVIRELGMNYEIGDIILEEDARSIAHVYARALVEVMRGPAKSKVAKELMITDDLDFSLPVDYYSFSGGIAEMFYGVKNFYNDIGLFLAQELKSIVQEIGLSMIEPPTKIRATVIGAGAFSLSVSGSTCYFDKTMDFPITNIPVLPINITTENYRSGIVETEVDRAFKKHDLQEGNDIVALYFKDPLYRSYSWLQEFVKAIESSLSKTVSQRKLVILLFASDIGKMVGLMARRETSIQQNLISLDELFLEEGDWIDIGAPLHECQVFPVTVKSLVFNKNKEYP
ncbi:MAG: ethanolamine ammonia-lyase reactivating factor EutA [Promethearchaeota archaeon]